MFLIVIENGGGLLYCNQCGHELENSAKFCSNCGNSENGDTDSVVTKQKKDALKMEQTWKETSGVCECGHKEIFNTMDKKIFNFNDKKPGFRFHEPFVCPNCKTEYNSLQEILTDEEKRKRSTSGTISGIGCIGLIVGGLILIIYIGTAPDDNPTMYDTGDPEDATVEESAELLEWLIENE